MIRTKSLITLAFIWISLAAIGQSPFKFESAHKLNEAINSEYEETSPIYHPGSETLYFTRTLHPSNIGGAQAGQDIWSSLKTRVSWSMPTNGFPLLNNQLNNSVIGISSDGNRLFLLGTYERKISLQQGFSVSENLDGKWSKPKPLSVPGLKFNSDFYGGWLSDDGNILIISMDGKNSLGQEDLYISIKTDGEWSKPEWLGEKINSTGYEISPMLVNDNSILLFASNGHQGLGDCDIYYATRLDSTFTNWSAPTNLGAPVNSSRFDAYPFLFEDQLYFASNRADTFNDIYVAINTEFFKEADTLRLAFKYFETQLNDVEVTVKESSGEVVGSFISDANGQVNLSGLKQNTDYLLFPTHKEVDMRLFSPYVLNNKGEVVEKLEQNADGSIAAKALSTEEYDEKSVMEVPKMAAGMQGIFELDRVPVRNVLLALVDETGRPVQYAKTDQRGRFAFGETDDSLKLNIRVLSQLEYLKSEGVIFFTDKNGQKLFRAKANDKGSFEYQKLEAQQLAQLKMLQQVERNSAPIESKGVYKYKNLPKEGVKLFLYDENDNLIETVVTDENGEFIFKKLRPDQAFKIKTSEEDDTELTADAFLYLYDKNGNEIDLFGHSNGGKGFDYKPLSSDMVSGLQLMSFEDGGLMFEEETTENMVFSTGLFKYQNLPREGITLKLLDEHDNVIETVTTDANGQFVFSMLRNNANYRIQVENLSEEAIDQSQIYFVGQQGSVTSAQKEDNKTFAFNNINPEYFFSISQVNEGETQLLLTESFKDVNGKFKYKNLPKEGVKLYLVDEFGNVLETVITDAEGNFKFSKLAREKNYVIRLSEEDAGMMDESAFAMTGEDNQELEQEIDDSGEFKFATLPKQTSKLNGLAEVEDSSLDAGKFIEEPADKPIEVAEIPVKKTEPVVQESLDEDLAKDDMKLHQVMFAFNSIRVSERDRFYINQHVMRMAKRSNEPILIVGYSCNLGEQKEQEEISLLRAQQIKEYLIGMGIDESRIEITGVGSTLTEENSTYQTRAENRKAEIYLLGR